MIHFIFKASLSVCYVLSSDHIYRFCCKIVETELCILFCSKILGKIAAISAECSHLANIFVCDFVVILSRCSHLANMK